MPVNLGEDHYLSKGAARKLLVAFNRSIKGTKDEPRTIRGISTMTSEELENKLKEFNVKKKKSGDVLTHKQVISKRYTELIPKNTKMKKGMKKAGTKDAPSKTDPGTEDYTGKKGDISKSKGKDVKKDNPNVDFEKKKKKKRSAKQLANDKKLGEMAKKRAAAKKNKK